LIKINQPEDDIETDYPTLSSHQHKGKANTARDDMKDIVRHRAARQTLLTGQQKSGNASENQHRREDHQGYIVEALLFRTHDYLMV
jgi:hypothetical protein